MSQMPSIDNMAGTVKKDPFTEFMSTQNTLCLDPIYPMVHISSQRLGLRASASEFVPQLDFQENIQLTGESDDDSSYDMNQMQDENNVKKISKHLMLESSYPINHYEDLRANHDHLHSTCSSSSTEKSTLPIAQPPPELANGLPHFKGPYMPLLRHRMANAEAYGLVKVPNGFNHNSLLLQDLVQQLSKLDSFNDLNNLTNDLAHQSQG